MRFNGYTPLSLLLSPHDDAAQLISSAERLQQAGLIERASAETEPASPALIHSWAERVSQATMQRA
jgi:hypothetical protein